jgi:hypothetical protein
MWSPGERGARGELKRVLHEHLTVRLPKIPGDLRPLCTDGGEEEVVRDGARIRTAFGLFAATAILVIVGCNRIDPLSYTVNPAGTAALTDSLVGEDARVVCVTPPKAQSCSPWNADVYVTDLQNLMDIEARWKDDSTVGVTVASGNIRRAAAKSRDGTIAILVTRGPREPLLILSKPPDGKIRKDVLPWPPPGKASR